MILGNTYIFLIVSMVIFLTQLVTVMAIFYITARLVGWPIKTLIRSMRGLIRKA